MDIVCPKCQRDFSLDDRKVANLKTVRCLCGAPLSLKPGALPLKLGKYLLLRRIATGGMGEIYYAKSAGIEGFEREFAIKKMLPHLSADRNFINMMVKEAKLTVLLNHPNIVQVYDLSKEGEEYYIAMEYVPGINVGQLLEYCRDRKILVPTPVALHIAAQVLKGLSYAHALRGPDGAAMHVLHRDITPQNILVTKQGWVKITDFGIAKARNEISTTSPGMIRGKLGYIAPEQLLGLEPDHRLDIFCVGILLWETLAARRLFKGTDEIDTIRLITEARVPGLQQIRADVSPEVEACLAKGLAKEPKHRFPSAEAFYEALTKAVAPATVDDCAKATRDFLNEHPDAFAKLFADNEGDFDGEDSPTVALKMAGENSREITITDLIKRRKSGARFAALASALLIVVAGGTAGGLYYWKHKAGSGTETGADDPPKDPIVTSTPLTKEEVQGAVDREHEALTGCYKQASAAALKKLESLGATIVVAGTGAVTEVQIKGSEQAWGKAGSCVKEKLSALKLRTHSAPSFAAEVELPPVPQSEPVASSKDPQTQARRPITLEEINKAVSVQSAAIVRCAQKMDPATAPEAINLTLQISINGKVGEVTSNPPVEGAAGKCLVAAMRALRLHPGTEEVQVTVPLKLPRAATP